MPDEGEALIAAAGDELYGLDPAGFTQRRNELAAAARKAGEADAAKQIAALRRPTRAAWILNQLARADAGRAGDFGALGEQLREAHLALDGAQIRELTRQRRQLIDQTAAQAFAAVGITAPTASLRDDVTATLGAVLADPAVAWRFAAGILVAAEDQSGFGPAGAQLSAVPTLRVAAGEESGVEEPGAEKPDAGEPGAGEPVGDSPAAVRSNARAVRERSRRQAALAKAQAALDQARAAKDAADAAVAQASEAVRQLTDQLADATRREDDALLDARHAELQLTKAQVALGRVDA
jgi:hypothetical protein